MAEATTRRTDIAYIGWREAHVWPKQSSAQSLLECDTHAHTVVVAFAFVAATGNAGDDDDDDDRQQ